ncbi:MAG: flagellin [Lachnospiraceae bacterium]
MNGISGAMGTGNKMNYGKIASGKKINAAKDGASELAIAKKLETQSKGQTVGASNAKDGQNMTNVADGALSGIQDSLQRIREISVKAMSGINSSSDKSAMQQEISSLMKGIQDTAKGTEFNTMKILDGSKASMNMATNPDGTGMEIQMANSTLESLGIDGYDVTGDFDISKIDDALSKVSESRSSLGASSNALSSVYNSNTNGALQQTSAQSKLEDLDVPKAISDLKKNEVLDDYKNTMLKKQMSEESIVTKLLQ